MVPSDKDVRASSLLSLLFAASAAFSSVGYLVRFGGADSADDTMRNLVRISSLSSGWDT